MKVELKKFLATRAILITRTGSNLETIKIR